MTVDQQCSTAPGFDPEAVGLPWWRRAWAQGVGYLLPSLLFLGIPLFAAWGNVPWPTYVALAVLIAVLAVLYVATSLVTERSLAVRWGWWLAIGATLIGIAAVTQQVTVLLYYAAFLTVPAATLFPWRIGRVLIVLVGAAGLIASIVLRDFIAFSLVVMAVILGFSIGAGIDSGRNRRAFEREQGRSAMLAVAAERERIGRDLHDILGHSLTAIAVKAQLAQRLLERDPEAARAQIAEVEQISRQALADVRSTTSGMREVRLATELASARSVLQAAGITSEAPSAVPVLDDATSEVLGYALREAVTNVVRHSGATRCVITVDPVGLTVADDGAGTRAPEGNGLRGLRARLAEHDLRLEIDADRGTTLRVRREVGDDHGAAGRRPGHDPVGAGDHARPGA